MDGEPDYIGQEIGSLNTKIRDIEEKQRILKDRVILIGQNLIEMKEKTLEEFTGIKKELETLTKNMERLHSFFETASGEFSSFAKREDLEILSRELKMLRPFGNLKKEKNG